MSNDHARPSNVVTTAKNAKPLVVVAGAITVGRNVGARPMSSRRWRQFVASIEQLIRRRGGLVHLTAYGAGRWQDVIEDAAVITFEVSNITPLLTPLSRYAWIYQQDAIALLSGTTTLVDGRHQIDEEANSAQKSLVQ